MRKIYGFFKWLFGYKMLNPRETQDLIEQEVDEIKEMNQSVREIKVIHEEISNKLDSCINQVKKKELVINPRLSSGQLRVYLANKGVLETKEMSRKEKQYYAKKVYFLKNKIGMKIIFDKTTKSYKYFINGGL